MDEGERFFKFFMRFWWHHPNNNILGVIKDYKETNYHAQVDHVTCIKGIVHPKMKILSSFTHPQVIPNLYAFLCSTEHKGRKFVTRLFWGTIDFHSRRNKYYGSQWWPRTALFPTFFRISSFVFARTKTFIHVWNYLRVNDDKIFIFGWTIPLRKWIWSFFMLVKWYAWRTYYS